MREVSCTGVDFFSHISFYNNVNKNHSRTDVLIKY